MQPATNSCAVRDLLTCKPPWRNWLARSAVNRKVGGSSPPGGAPVLQKHAYLREIFVLGEKVYPMRPRQDSNLQSSDP